MSSSVHSTSVHRISQLPGAPEAKVSPEAKHSMSSKKEDLTSHETITALVGVAILFFSDGSILQLRKPLMSDDVNVWW